MDAYSEAHLFVAAVRLLQHRGGYPPAIEEVAEMLDLSVEMAHTICRRLSKAGIVEALTDPFTVKLAVANHLAIEELPRTAVEENSLARELARFQSEKKNVDEKVAAIQAEMAKKRQDLFADLEAKFKKEMAKHKKE